MRKSQNEYEQGRANFLMIFVKKALFFIDSTNLGFQPAVSLAKNVRTPNSVWGKTTHVCERSTSQIEETERRELTEDKNTCNARHKNS